MTAGRSARRLAIVGCGAAARECHLPSLVGEGPFRLVALVDRLAEHATAAAQRYVEFCADQGVAVDGPLETTDDLSRVLPGIDAAVVATANSTHVEVAVALLRAGKHVLVEKPLALTVAECEEIRAAAVDGGAVALPAHSRRLYPAARWVKQQLDEQVLGEVIRVRWSQGRVFAWPIVSSFTFEARSAGGGELIDIGPHVIDMLLYWFGQPAEVTSFQDNSDGGTDSEARIELVVGSVPAVVELSRLRDLGNCCVIEGALGSLTVGIDRSTEFVVRDRSGRLICRGPVPVLPPAQNSRVAQFRQQFVDFDGVISGRATQLATFDDGVATIRVIEACRALRSSSLPRPWEAAAWGSDPDVAGRVAVTGATGFIGSNVVEAFLRASDGSTVVAVGRSLPRLARLSHLDPARLGFVHADIRDRRALVEAFRGCDVVVHAGYSFTGSDEERWSISVEGTAAALAAAVECGVRRFIHVSTMAVYDRIDQATLDEASAPLPEAVGDLSYPQQKLAAERLVMERCDGPMEVVVVQPAVVYGPWSPLWTLRPLKNLRTGSDLLPSGPEGGICNAVHVHDVAEAVLFVVRACGVDRLRLLVSGPDTVGWGRYYDAYRDLLGVARHDRHDDPRWEDRYRALFSSRTVVNAGRLASLGFRPRVGFDEGMKHMATWATWAGLV